MAAALDDIALAAARRVPVSVAKDVAKAVKNISIPKYNSTKDISFKKDNTWMDTLDQMKNDGLVTSEQQAIIKARLKKELVAYIS